MVINTLATNIFFPDHGNIDQVSTNFLSLKIFRVRLFKLKAKQISKIVEETISCNFNVRPDFLDFIII